MFSGTAWKGSLEFAFYGPDDPQVRPIDHETGSHGVPGIYFKYDMSALKVIVNQASMHGVCTR